LYGAIFADTDPAISTVASAAKDGELGVTNVTMLVLGKWQHPWRCPSTRKAYGLFFRGHAKRSKWLWCFRDVVLV